MEKSKMEQVTDNPCVICGELKIKINSDEDIFMTALSTDWKGILPWSESISFYQNKYNNHKRICNVHRVWIGGRG